MYVATVPNRGSPPAILLRESYREDGRVKTRTLKNLTGWPAERIDLLRAVLRGDQLVPAGEGVAIEQALPHGHVLAALETARRIGLDRLLPRQGPQRRRDLALALIVARLLEPAAKLATARALDPATASHSLGTVLGLGRVTAKDTYSALDWLGRQPDRIEAALARRHLATAGGPLQLSLFDERDLAEITSPDYPGERLVVCRNPLLAAERARKRHELLDATEAELHRIQQRVGRPRNPLTGAAAIGQAVGAVLGRHKMAKNFQLSITDNELAFKRDEATIAAEARLDGIYVLRTSLSPEQLDAASTVHAYKGLAHVERAFRSLKSLDLAVRPVFHWTASRVRAHVFLCLLAYYLEWHMRRDVAPLLFDDHDRAAAAAQRASPVAPAKVSPAARRKAATKLTETRAPVTSFRSLLRHLACLTRNTVRLARDHTTILFSVPTPLQQHAFDLLTIKLPT
jgi:hypothetical protein